MMSTREYFQCFFIFSHLCGDMLEFRFVITEKLEFHATVKAG